MGGSIHKKEDIEKKSIKNKGANMLLLGTGESGKST
jgi:hypothetical protein